MVASNCWQVGKLVSIVGALGAEGAAFTVKDNTGDKQPETVFLTTTKYAPAFKLLNTVIFLYY